MARIRIIRGGCGIAYRDRNGKARHALKTTESEPFECDDEQAARLVKMKVAVYETETADGADQEPEGNGQTRKAVGRLSKAWLEEMDYARLKKLAGDMGATPKGKKKADLIEAISEIEVEAEAMPNPSAEDLE